MNFSNADVVLVPLPFSDQTATKARPAIVVSAPHPSRDLFVVALTSRLEGLLPGEFVLADWQSAGLNVPSALKRAVGTISSNIVLRRLGRISGRDARAVRESLRLWLGLQVKR